VVLVLVLVLVLVFVLVFLVLVSVSVSVSVLFIVSVVIAGAIASARVINRKVRQTMFLMYPTPWNTRFCQCRPFAQSPTQTPGDLGDYHCIESRLRCMAKPVAHLRHRLQSGRRLFSFFCWEIILMSFTF
jgi:hypothetical protein